LKKVPTQGDIGRIIDTQGYQHWLLSGGSFVYENQEVGRFSFKELIFGFPELVHWGYLGNGYIVLWERSARLYGSDNYGVTNWVFYF